MLLVLYYNGRKGTVEMEFVMGKESRVQDGLYSGIAHIGASKATDGEAHELAFTGNCRKMFRNENDVDYGYYLAGLDLALRAKVKAESGLLISAPKLSDEEKAERKGVSAAKRAERKAVSEVVESLGLSVEDVKRLLSGEGK